MRIRVFGSPFIHRVGRSDERLPVCHTACKIKFIYIDRNFWPQGDPRPPLPKCGDCFA